MNWRNRFVHCLSARSYYRTKTFRVRNRKVRYEDWMSICETNNHVALWRDEKKHVSFVVSMNMSLLHRWDSSYSRYALKITFERTNAIYLYEEQIDNEAFIHLHVLSEDNAMLSVLVLSRAVSSEHMKMQQYPCHRKFCEGTKSIPLMRRRRRRRREKKQWRN
jgi:hypothetical protein